MNAHTLGRFAGLLLGAVLIPGAFAAPPQTAFEKSLENIYFLRLFERTSIKRRYPLLYSSQKRNTPGITVIIGVKIRYPPSARDEKKKLI